MKVCYFVPELIKRVLSLKFTTSPRVSIIYNVIYNVIFVDFFCFCYIDFQKQKDSTSGKAL